MVPDLKQRIDAMSLPAASTIRQTMQTIDKEALGVALLIEPKTKRFVGLVTDGDIRRALLNGYGLESAVSDVPRPEPKKARVGMTSCQIADLFSEPVRVVPLLDDNDRVVYGHCSCILGLFQDHFGTCLFAVGCPLYIKNGTGKW